MLPTLKNHRTLRLTTLCALYAAQGMPDGFVRTGLKTYLIDQGVSTIAVGNMVALVSWPWALKWLWGPVVDRYRYSSMGKRRPWILSAQFGLMLMLAGMLLRPDLVHDLWWLGLIVFMANVFASLQDVSVDALAVDLLPEKDRGIANGFMFASSYGGQFLGASVLGGLLLTSGLGAAVGVQMALLFVIALFPLLLRENTDSTFLPFPRGKRPHASQERTHTIREQFGKLARAFSVRSSWLAGLFSVSSLVAVSAHLVFWPAYLQRRLGWTSEEYLLLEGGFSVWFGLVGSVVGGVAASVFGTKRTVAIALVALSACWLAHAAVEPVWDHSKIVTALFLLATFFAGFLQVAMFAMFMSIAWPPVAATQFTAYMALLNVSNGLGARLAGHLETWFEMRHVFLLLCAYQAATLLLLIPIDPGQTRRRLGE